MTGRRSSAAALLFHMCFIGTVFVVYPRRASGGRSGWVSPRRGPPLERVSSAVLATGCAMQLAAQSVTAFRGRPNGPRSIVTGAGGALGFGAAALAVASQRAMGEAWSTSVATTSETPLITHGVFASVRNPIYTSFIVAAIAAAMMSPTRVALPSVGLVIAALELQVRVVEEPVLERVHGDRYRAYRRRTGRFVPRRTHSLRVLRVPPIFSS